MICLECFPKKNLQMSIQFAKDFVANKNLEELSAMPKA
jgi:hypothetical protein